MQNAARGRPALKPGDALVLRLACYQHVAGCPAGEEMGRSPVGTGYPVLREPIKAMLCGVRRGRVQTDERVGGVTLSTVFWYGSPRPRPVGDAREDPLRLRKRHASQYRAGADGSARGYARADDLVTISSLQHQRLATHHVGPALLDR